MPVLVRYADDLLAFCHSREQAEQVKADLAEWLEPRGLRFNEDKTRVVQVEDGFSFLGFDIRRRLDRQGSAKLFITPSKESVKRLRKRLAADVRAMHGANAAAVVFRLYPVVGGWSAYYRSVVSGKIFDGLDHHVWDLTYRWARRSHPNKSRLGRVPVFRQVQQVPAGPVGFRRPRQRRLPHEVLLDEDRPACSGSG
jgi:RNA-directed DNA polymerase